MTDLSGQYLGRYYLAERLGEGGMAVVYKAYDTRLERDVAIKIIRSGAFPADAIGEVLKRFEREAKSLARLSHPNIVKVYDFGEHEGSPFLVMEYLPGGTLKKRLGQPLPWQEAVRLILPVARGIAYAHQHGILHRDIKPANVLITDGGEPMLSDFGIAKLFEGSEATALTGSGMAIGTPEYMAPEQWTGITSPKSDLYSLGIVLYELVTGRKPYVADTPAAILIKQATEPLPNPRRFAVDLPEAMELILVKALAKEPEDRYEDLNAFIRALENLPISVSITSDAHFQEKPSGDKAKSPLTESVTAVSAQALSTEEHEIRSNASTVIERRTPITFSRKWIGLVIGAIAIVVVAGFSVSLMGKRFSLAPVATKAVTNAPLPVELFDEKNVQMLLVPAGEFTMGSDQGNPDEKPAHQVYLNSFYIDKYEVTNGLYRTCVTAGHCPRPKNGSSTSHAAYYGNPEFDDYPVIYVDWNMVKAYCDWRGAQLPTEAQWEKAARGLRENIYPWGDSLDCSKANYYDAAHSKYCVGDTSRVGSYPAGKSDNGVFDLIGNVAEWVSDWYSADYYQNSFNQNPSGPALGQYRIFRGGSWSTSTGLSVTLRLRDEPTYASYDLGFRCAKYTNP
jgi:eukaryotic-like serine/threonine-protein kinase